MVDLVLERRLARGLVTVVDTLGLDAGRRRAYLDRAHRHGVACWAVVFDTPAEVCRARNRTRDRPVPAKVLAAQLRSHQQVRAELADEAWDHVAGPDDTQVVPADLLTAPQLADRQRGDPMPLRFGLQLPSFTWQGGPAQLAGRLAAIAAAAEDVGFTSIWVMDHMLQIPQVGREWEDMLESWTTLGYLAGRTTHGPAGHAGHRRHLPQRRPPGQDGRDPRRPVGAVGPSAGWARRGGSASTGPTAGLSHRCGSASPSWRTRSSCCR